MKRPLLGLIALAIGCLASLQASNGGCCDPCSWCCGRFEVGGQWIYLRPTSCDYDFVIKDPRTFNQSSNPTNSAFVQSVTDFVAHLPSGKSHGIDPDYESGFRVSLGYIMDCSCYDVRVEYTYHHPCDSAKVFGGENNCGLWPTYMHPRYARNFQCEAILPVPANSQAQTEEVIDTLTGFETPIFSGTPSISGVGFTQAMACSSVKLDYDAVDLQFGSRSMKSQCLWMRTYAGLHFMNLDHRHKAQYRGVFFGNDVRTDDGQPVATSAVGGLFDTHVCWNKNTWGIGPLFGLDARYEVACGFGIGGHFGAAILAGETDGKMTERDRRMFPDGSVENTGNFSSKNVDETLCVRHDHRNLLFPYLRASLGVNYLWCCGDCFTVLVEVGYEFHSYINAIGQFRFNDQRGTGMANCYSYNLDGIYVSVRATI